MNTFYLSNQVKNTFTEQSDEINVCINIYYVYKNKKLPYTSLYITSDKTTNKTRRILYVNWEKRPT